jgi:hypothetical protein
MKWVWFWIFFAATAVLFATGLLGCFLRRKFFWSKPAGRMMDDSAYKQMANEISMDALS